MREVNYIYAIPCPTGPREVPRSGSSSSLEVTFLVLVSFRGRDKAFCSNTSRPCLDLQHPDCIAWWEIAKIFVGVRSFPNFFHIYTKSTATPSSAHTSEIRRLLLFLVIANSKICLGRSRNSSVVESQSDFVSERSFFQFHEQ